jgi:hypothetical protein
MAYLDSGVAYCEMIDSRRADLSPKTLMYVTCELFSSNWLSAHDFQDSRLRISEEGIDEEVLWQF